MDISTERIKTMFETKIDLPEGFEASYEDGELTIKGEGNELTKKMEHALVEVETENGEIIFSTDRKRSDIHSIAKTFRSIASNMVEGLQEEYIYKMKGVYAHFPMTVKTQNNQVVIENFMGERHPRTIDIEEGVQVEVDGEDLELRGVDKEKVGLTAGKIEQACRKGNRDPRTFQDGVYITEKGDKQ